MIYKLVSPENEIVEFKSVTHFCRERGLNVANIYNVLRGTGKVCHGWRLVDPSKPYAIRRFRKNENPWTTPNPSPTA
ncbi:hypothetical protein [Nostoc sp. TCL240-02]|uniref:hypothetical protein n=1 Tax=Nostoc sp. TCL240-02 TaxID=2572090 RepID=UPI00157F9217|nr:hypothetical protein [Nostoc sp. TCL240-02]QKQ75645.1 hypothetical protein FBB35_22220 [Nostoc sp. TCL240-02]